MKFQSTISLAFLGSSSMMSLMPTIVSGDKDTSYYSYPNFVNPNIYYKMYWKDAQNVISDMDEFSALYVTHHGCVWSPSTSGDENRNGGDDDYWYIGGPQRFRANTAYSLYGVLKGHVHSGCHKGTYINSFFTTSGVETLAYPLGIDTSYVDSTCGGNRGSHDRALMETSSADFERDVIRGHGRRLSGSQDSQDGGYSYGTGCSAKNTYVSDMFGGKYCDGSQYVETVDTLDAFNGNMTTIQCTQVYDSKKDSSAYDSLAYTLLTYSSACDRKLYQGSCPDPHGLLSKYTRNLEKAQSLAANGIAWEQKEQFPFVPLTLIFSLVGAGLLYLSHKFKPATAGKKTTKNIEMSTFSGGDSVMEDRYARESPTKAAPADDERSIASKMSQSVKSVAESIKQSLSVDPTNDIDENYRNNDDDFSTTSSIDPMMAARQEADTQDAIIMDKYSMDTSDHVGQSESTLGTQLQNDDDNKTGPKNITKIRKKLFSRFSSK